MTRDSACQTWIRMRTAKTVERKREILVSGIRVHQSEHFGDFSLKLGVRLALFCFWAWAHVLICINIFKSKFAVVPVGPRCLHRKALLKALADKLTIHSVRFSSKISAIDTQQHEGSSLAIVHLENGTIIKTKISMACVFGNLSKQNVTVAGDAMHPMTPDLAQGGGSALEDAVVLGRHIGQSFVQNGRVLVPKEMAVAIDKYVQERRWHVRCFVDCGILHIGMGATRRVWLG
ncbi:putative zeaxanthin epoxidase [Rosa chinensis]|uniref:Putative zeaxanthin epoxidase n=1 Tax=Rosa chinensis TaxID=74649 RepID=A0A2P6RS26_ROSCH|nr:putative zeaxanthin epoxidase [Rosa chinensis]